MKIEKKKIILIIGLLLFVGLIVGGTFAYWTWYSTENKSVVFNTVGNVSDYIVYDEGASYFIGDFKPTDSYCESVNTTVSFYKTEDAEDIELRATINMDVNSIGSNIANSSDVYWVVTKGDGNITCSEGLSSDIVLGSGTFYGKTAGETIKLATDIEITTTEQKYTVWIWINSEGTDLGKLSGETVDTNVWTQIDMVDPDADNDVENDEDVYTIMYNVNGGMNGPSNETLDVGQNAMISSVVPIRAGYTFNGWNTIADGSGTNYSAGIVYSQNKDLLLYAVWIPNTYTISYSANGGSGTTTTNSCSYGKSCTLTNNGFTRTGYTFLGWSDSETGTEIVYKDGYTILVYDKMNNMTLYALWKIDTYTISYDGNFGDGEPSEQTKTYGETLILSSNVPTRKNYKFIEWNTKSDGSGTSYQPGDRYNVESGLTLYAVWEFLGQYTIKYNANNGTGIMEDTLCSYNINCTLRTNTFARTGYVFSGWNTKADGSGTSYANSQIVKNIVPSGEDVIILYAQWSTYILTFEDQTFSATYSGSSQTKTITGASNGSGNYTYSISGDGSSYFSISGTTLTIASKTPANIYSLTVTVKDNNFGSSKSATFIVTVNKVLLTPSVRADEKTYDGSSDATCYLTLSGAVAGESPSAIVTSCKFSDANAGTNKTITLSGITLANDWTTNYTLSSSSATTTGTINQAKTATTGSCVSDLVYNGLPQTLASGGSYVTYSNNSQTNANTSGYTVTVKTDENHQFSDGTESKELSCSIAKKESTMILSSTSLSITMTSSGSGSFTYTYDGDGNVICSSSNTNVATCSVNSSTKTVTVTAKAEGNVTITTSAEVGTNYLAISKTTSVIIQLQTYSVSQYHFYYAQNTTWTHFDTTIDTVSYGNSFAPYNVTSPTGYHPRDYYDYFKDDYSTHLGSGIVGTNSFTVNENVKISVYYDPDQYVISYDMCSGTNGPSSQTKYYGVTLKLSNTIPTRSKYTFLGWATESAGGCNATSATYSAGSDYTSNAAVKLYAVWQTAQLGTYLINNRTNISTLSDSLSGGLYRYQGTHSDVNNNYICFGTSNKSTCTSNTDTYMYRIIGIDSNGNIKLIKHTPLSSLYKWHTSSTTSTANVHWVGSYIYKNLNAGIFLTNTSYVPSGWSDKIKSVSWYYTSGNSTATNAGKALSLTGENMYLYEIGQYSSLSDTVATVNAKIALMHRSDFVLSLGSSNKCSESSPCSTSWMYLPNYYSVANSLGATTYQQYEWTMDKLGWTSAEYQAYAISLRTGGGWITVDYGYYGRERPVRPVFFVSSSVSLSGGTGTSSDPYLLS